MHLSSYQSPNRTDFCWFDFILKNMVQIRFGSVRLYFEKHGSSSVRFDFILKNMARARFCSTLFRRTWFGFGSVRPHFENTGSGSVRFRALVVTIRQKKIDCLPIQLLLVIYNLNHNYDIDEIDSEVKKQILSKI